MLDEALIRENARQRIGAGLRFVPAVLLLTVACTLWLPDFAAAAFLLLIVALIVSAIQIERLKVICPECRRDVSPRYQWLLATRRCPLCETRIVAGGVVRRNDVYRRHLRIRGRSLLQLWFWAWPLMATVGLVVWLVDRGIFQQNPMPILLPALLGTATSGYTVLRTRDRRYVMQLVASFVLLASGVTMLVNGW